MTKREIGLMGYIGEAVVDQWLRRKYPPTKYQVVSQIIPSGIPKAGGGYLDFGVIRNNVVKRVYEVKSQDYSLGGDINKALRYIWKRKRQSLNFETQVGNKYVSHPDMQAFLVLLVGPTKAGLQKIGGQNLPYIILFQEIWSELEDELDFDSIIDNFREDTEKVISILKYPSSGKRNTESFLESRANYIRKLKYQKLMKEKVA